jgi:CheY-like chemotaxis protein
MKILIIEDEWIIAHDLKLMLKTLGYNVLCSVDNGQDAVKITEQLKPDIIFMDIKLKGEISGIDAAEVILQRFGKSVIYITAYQDPETYLQAFKTKPIAYINKPFTDLELECALEKAVSSKITAMVV